MRVTMTRSCKALHVPMLRLVPFIIAITLSGCATTADVVPAAQGTYVIRAANLTCDECESPQTRASRRASAYCTKLNKAMVTEDSQESYFDLGFVDRYTLTFSCVTASAAAN